MSDHHLQITGRHARFFDDDAAAAFVNSNDALVASAADSSLLIDRYDARHLVDRIPPRPKPRKYVYKDEEEVAEELVAQRERYLDLVVGADDDELQSDDKEVGIQGQGTFTAVPFSYGNTGEEQKDGSDSKIDVSSSVYRPPFSLPESLMNHLPPSEKAHQIISKTAKFVSQHGGQSEIVLRVKQGNNPTFGFLMPDHHLHPYFRFLVQNPNLSKTLNSDGGGALSLLGSVYGEHDDDDNDDVITPPTNPNPKSIEKDEKNDKINSLGTKNGNLQSEEKKTNTSKFTLSNIGDLPSEEKLPVKKNPSIVKVKEPVRMMEPDSVMRNAMEKIAEFVLRNGRELEMVLLEQDKKTNRFPFLVESSVYHAYYLKVLEEIKEGKKSEESSNTDSKTKPRTRESTRSPSSEPQKHEKFKMVLSSKPSKPDPIIPANQNRPPGLTTQEAAAIVQAATRGKSSSVWSQMMKKDQGLKNDEKRPVKSSSDDAWISETIKKTAALVSADVAVSLFKESKEEKVKAERLKRAKMLSSMIKSSGDGGPHLNELLNKVTKVDENGGESSKRDRVEREGTEKEKVEVMRRHEGSKRESKNYRKREESSDSEERERRERSKRDRPSDERRSRRKHHSSSDEERERRERKRERDDRYRKRRHSKRDYSDYSSESEEDRHRKRSHRHEHRKSSSERRREYERVEGSSSNLGEKREQSTDVPDELRAKIRAMLLQTL